MKRMLLVVLVAVIAIVALGANHEDETYYPIGDVVRVRSPEIFSSHMRSSYSIMQKTNDMAGLAGAMTSPMID